MMYNNCLRRYRLLSGIVLYIKYKKVSETRRNHNVMEMDLQIEVRRNGNYAILDLVGEVDAYTAGRFREIMLNVIEEGHKDVIVCMQNVQYIDSSGLGALVGGLKRVSEKKGRIVIVCDNQQVKKVFEITGLEKVFQIFAFEIDAIQAVSV